ncbi:Cytochrome P450 monooxygenase [Lachnellula willkommii]|uniref:Cytochrome P450 monooxygenase n=1 Tax=Lachnellula willkommii TaxID=215461 RepID=A0A559M786_9HELO|nr:Cytochrome P450 monooxygenase [Lachnellula willkommii]
MVLKIDANIFNRLVTLFISSIILTIVWTAGKIVYNLWFHPLAGYPGPKLAAITRLRWARKLGSGVTVPDVQKLHKKYGPVVRIAPNELSYIDGKAWKDIYGHRSGGQEEMYKDPNFYLPNSFRVPDILNAPRQDHSRFRHLVSHAFSERALREQESLIQLYVDMLVSGIRKHSEGGTKPLDMVSWYNWTTFDIIGDLAFGEPFDCLANATYHPWVDTIFRYIKVRTFNIIIKWYPAIKPLVNYFMVTERMKSASAEHSTMTLEKARKRMEAKTDKHDFMSYIMRASEEKAMTESEVAANSMFLILAGSETTATLLSGATYYLLRNPDVKAKLVQEIRSTFSSESEITMDGTKSLVYLNAFLQESLRMYPPIPAGFPRVVPTGGAQICGRFVPEGTRVSVHQYSTYHDPRNFFEPDSFFPERFLGDPRFANDNQAALEPFSVGPRNCIGKNLAYAEMQVIVSKILWNFDLVLDPASNNWSKQDTYRLWEKPPLLVRPVSVVR